MVGGMYPPHHLGGYELVWQAFVRHARERGHEVGILTSDLQIPGADGPEEPAVRRELGWHVRARQPRLHPREALRRERGNAAAFDRAVDELRPELVMWWHMLGVSLGLLERARRRGL